MAYYVRPPDPYVLEEREREEKLKEQVRKHTAEVARETYRMNMEQEALERQQRHDREERRKLVEEEEDEARELAGQMEREERVSARARRILAERGYEGDAEMVG